MRDALPSLGELEMISIDIDPNENAEQLRRYADQQGFRWRFAVASRDMIRALGAAYGTEFITPPSEPMLIVDPRRQARALPFGRKDAGALRTFVERARAG